MIDKPEQDRIIETTSAGASKYQPLALYLLGATGADAVAVVIINGMYGTGGSSAASTEAALRKLPDALRVVADAQAQQIVKRPEG